MGAVLRTLGRNSEAEPYLRERLERSLSSFGESHTPTIQSLGQLALLLDELGKKDEAEQYYRKAFEAARQHLDAEHSYIAWTAHLLGDRLSSTNQFEEAEILLQAAVEARRRQFGEEHPETIEVLRSQAFLLASIGEILLFQGRIPQAVPYLREALEKSTDLQGADHPRTLNYSLILGEALTKIGKLSEGEPYLERARKGFLGPGNELSLQSRSGDRALRLLGPGGT
jgi:tetratricopeptide (TPR) repeat protein